jgi:hypothetical protein
MKQILLSVLAAMGVAISAMAQTQQGTVHGLVLDENQKPMEYATMMLVKASDSSLVKGSISGTNGRYTFEAIQQGRYMVAASMMGYTKLFSAPFDLTENVHRVEVPVIQMEQVAQKLKEVVVKGERPFLEQKIDRTVLNVENSIVSAGTNAMEVLEKAPGVVIDQDDRISMNGKNGVLVLIDGKQTYLSAAEVSNMLRNMQSNAVESIEIITNPSAKYDAAGNAGIINIKLKKDKNLGTNGSLTLGTGWGRYGKANAGLNLNHRAKKFNAFGSYNHGYNRNFNEQEVYRLIGNSVFDQRSVRGQEMQNLNYRVGADYFLNKHNTIGVLASGFFFDMDMNSLNTTLQSNAGSGALMSSINQTSSSDFMRKSNSLNVNYKRTFETAGRELTLDADYSLFNANVIDNILARSFNATGEEVGMPLQIRNLTPSLVDIRAIKGDYVHPLGQTAKIEAGFKSSLVVTDNDMNFNTYQETGWQRDLGRSNQFKYTENINAAYVNYNHQIKKVGVQLGLRAEQTISEGTSVTMDQKNPPRNYLEWFPSVFVSQKINDKHEVGYSYSRRIDRPSYQDLNPFVYFLDSLTYQEGNPYLNPQFTNSFKLTHTFSKMFVTSLGYSRTTDVMTRILIQDSETFKSKAFMENLASLDNFSLNISAPAPITKWWSTMNNLNVYYNLYNEPNLNGADLSVGMMAFNFNTNHSIRLPKDFTMELTGMYRSPTLDGIIAPQSMYFVAAGVQKTFLDKRASLRLNVSDIFGTMRFVGIARHQDIDTRIESRWESRVARLSFTYRFGRNEIKPARRRSTATEAEQNRVGSSNQN